QKEILQRQEDQTDARRVLEQEAVIYAVVSGFYDLELIRRRMELMKSKIEDARSLIRIKEQLFRRGTGSLAEMKQLALDTLRTDDRKSTRLNSSHVKISYAVFCLKKKKKNKTRSR